MTVHPDTTTKLIKQYYEKFIAQDLEGFLALLSDDVVHDINQGPTEKGKDLFRKFMIKYFECGKEDIQNLVILCSSDGKYASTHFVSSGKYTKTQPGCPEAKGQKWELPVVSFFEIEGDKISRVTVHYNVQTWKEQVAKAS